MNTNEQQWQECPLEEATHVRTATGAIFRLDNEKDAILEKHPDRHIYSTEFPVLGITPVRKAEVKPVEFTASFYRGVGGIWTHVTDPRTIPDDAKVLKFRCVEVQP